MASELFFAFHKLSQYIPNYQAFCDICNLSMSIFAVACSSCNLLNYQLPIIATKTFQLNHSYCKKKEMRSILFWQGEQQNRRLLIENVIIFWNAQCRWPQKNRTNMMKQINYPKCDYTMIISFWCIRAKKWLNLNSYK